MRQPPSLKLADNLNFESFATDETLKRAFVRSIAIIGEATKNLSEEFISKHHQIDWKSMARMRDKLIRGYFGIDYEIVWDVIQVEIPKLHAKVNQILEN